MAQVAVANHQRASAHNEVAEQRNVWRTIVHMCCVREWLMGYSAMMAEIWETADSLRGQDCVATKGAASTWQCSNCDIV